MSTLIKQSDGSFKKVAGLYKTGNESTIDTNTYLIAFEDKLANYYFDYARAIISNGIVHVILKCPAVDEQFSLQELGLPLVSKSYNINNIEDKQIVFGSSSSDGHASLVIIDDDLQYLDISATANRTVFSGMYIADKDSLNEIIGNGGNDMPNVTNTYTVTVNTSPNEGGTATGSGTYTAGTNVTFNAVAAEGYEFAGWKLDSSDAYWKTDTEFEYAVNANLVVTAVFVEEPNNTVIIKNDAAGTYNLYVKKGTTVSTYSYDLLIEKGTTKEIAVGSANDLSCTVDTSNYVRIYSLRDSGKTNMFQVKSGAPITLNVISPNGRLRALYIGNGTNGTIDWSFADN